MAAGGNFVKKNPKKIKVAYWSEMVRNVIELKVSYDHPKCPAAAILWHKFLQIKVAYWSVMARNAIETLRIDLK